MRSVTKVAILLSLSLVHSCAPESPATAPSVTEDASRSPLTVLLRRKDRLKNVPFSTVIEAATGRRILPLDPGAAIDRQILDAIGEAMTGVLRGLNAEDNPARGLRRINEASRHLEDALLAALDARPGFSCGIPPTAEGKEQRPGYPDLRLMHEASGRVAYLDPKLFEESGIASTLRTFYFEPAGLDGEGVTGKVLEDAHHILIGVAHDGNDGQWKFLRWHAVDLSGLNVRLKAEFQASNRDLYRPELIISGGEM